MFDVPTDGYPCGVAVSADGHVYVAQQGTGTIGVFAAHDGRQLRTLGEGLGAGERQLNCPMAVALSADGGLLYIADRDNHRVAVWRAADGAPLRSIGGGRGNGPGQLCAPYGLALSPDGAELFVVEHYNHRVSVFEPRTGRHLRSWGRRGGGLDDGKFNYPSYCALSRDGRVLFVADTEKYCFVRACDAASGGALWHFGKERVPDNDWGDGSGDYFYDDDYFKPAGLALSHCGRELFVADSGGNERVVVLSVDDGSVVRDWAVAGHPTGVGVGPDGWLFVASRDTSRLRKFS